MIVTDRFVYLHLHKSGGSFVNEFLLDCLPDARRIGYHLPRSAIPAAYAHLPVLGLVRNPWSYYVSWYAFQSQLPRANALFRLLSEEGTLDFGATLRRMLQLGDGGTLLDRLMAVLPPTYQGHGLNLPGPALAAIRNSRLGFYTFLYRYMYSRMSRDVGDAAGRDAGWDAGALRIGRMEHLRTELPAMLSTAGLPMSPRIEAHLQAARPLNQSRHAPYADYYDAPLAELVAERDAWLIERHAYRFSGRPGP